MVKGRLPPAQVAAAAGRLITKVAGPLAVGVAVYDFAKEMGFLLERSPSGSVTVLKEGAGWTCSTPIPPPGYQTDSNVTAIKLCVPLTAGSTNFVIGYNYYAPAYGWNGVTFPCGNSSCQTGEYWSSQAYGTGVANAPTPATLQQLTDAVAAKSGFPAGSKVNDVVLQDPNPELQTPVSITVTGPASSPGPRVTTTNTTNNTTKVDTSTFNYQYAGDTITTNVSNVSITTNNSTGAVTNQETTTSTPVSTVAPAPPPPTIVCGLPSTPACKIDETGTAPNAGTTYDAPKAAIDVAKASTDTAIAGAAGIPAPAWSFVFQLPTGCAPYVTGIKGVVLNVCQYQPTMHALLSAIWAAATAFAMIGMVGRTIREA